MRGKSTMAGPGAAGILIIVCVGSLILVQGGFFALPTCFVGVVASVAGIVAMARRGRETDPAVTSGVLLVPLLFVCVFAAFALSAAVNNLSLTTLSEMGAWAACASVSLLASSQGDMRRESTLRALAWLGVVSAILGLLVYVGLITLPEGMVGQRLQFTFQYANAAGSWFGTVTLLCLLLPDVRLRSLACLPATALLCTQSGGALMAFALVSAALAIRWAYWSLWGRMLLALAQGVVAIAGFALLVLMPTPVALLAIVVEVAASVLFARYASAIESQPHAKRIALALLLLVAVAIGSIAALMYGRVEEAMQTFGERLLHIRDGIAIWSSSPLTGIGPDLWQYVYRYAQSAPYDAATIHSSFVQVLVDAGLCGVVPLVAACACGLRGSRQTQHKPAVDGTAHECATADKDADVKLATRCAATLIVIHSLVDFDLQFSSLALLLAFLLSSADGPRVPLARRWVNVAAGIACAAGCTVGLLCASSSIAITAANLAGDYDTCRSMVGSNPLARADMGALSDYLSACNAQEDHEVVARAYGDMVFPSDADALCAADSLYALGNANDAVHVLIEHMEAQPYNDGFVRDARAELASFGLDASVHDRFEGVASTIEDALSDASY